MFKCLLRNKSHRKYFEEDWQKFATTYKFCDRDINKFYLMLRKGVYPYKYIDNWQKFNETSLPGKRDFYSNLTIKDTTDE